jgi:uncharacterized protein (DUF2147 family)
MKTTLYILFALFFIELTKAQNPPDVLGVWCSGKKDCKVQLYKNGNTIEGKVVWLLEDKDENGNLLLDSKYNKPLVGLKILWDAVYNPITNYFENGIAYVKGREFCGKFKLNKDGTLDVTGFICSLKFLKKTDTWTRVVD